MDNATPKSVPKIRTFADDFAAAQNQTQTTDTEQLATPAPKTPPPSTPPEKAAASEESESLQADIADILPEQSTTPTADTPAPLPPKDPVQDETYLDVGVGDEHVKKTETYDEDLESVEFVREKKRNKFRLFPAIKQSMQSWYTDTKEDLTAIPPESQVEDPRLRETTVEQAVEDSALPESDDHTVLAARIAKQPKVRAENTLQVTPSNELPTPQWSSSIEPKTVTEAETSPEPAPAASNQPEPTPAPSETTPVPEPEPEVEPQPAPTPAPPPPPPEVSEPEAPTPEPAPAPVAAPTPETEEPASEYQYRPTPVEPATRDWRWWLVIASVAIAAIVLGVTVSVWAYQYLTQPEHVLAPAVPSAVTVDRTQSVALTGSRDTVLSEMRAVLQAGTGMTQVYPIVATGDGTTRVATLTEFFTVVPLSAEGSFQRNITGLTIIGSNQQVGLVLEVASFETALGGMYGWESQIVTDLSALIGASPISQFTDTTSNNRDIRVAKRGDGSELLYTFLDRNTLLIATDRAIIGEVITRLK